MRAHSESERSVGYVFLMRGRVSNYHYLTPTFRTVSLGNLVNSGNGYRQKRGPGGERRAPISLAVSQRGRGRDKKIA